jgi:hypothetical protein
MKTADAAFADFIARRDALFRNPTLEAAKTFGHEPPGGWLDPINGPLAAVHKARLQWINATDAMLAESKAWLVARGYGTSFDGAPPLTPERRDQERAARGMRPLGADQ